MDINSIAIENIYNNHDNLLNRLPAKPLPPPSDPASPPAAVAEAAAATDTEDGIDEQIPQSVNKPGQKKANLLLKHLKKSKVSTWTPEGEIIYRGRAIPHSNIVDLMT
jgi:hypothetical protein